MTPLQTLGFSLGTSFASGLNLYATIATAGLLQRSGLIELPPGLQVLASPLVLGLAVTLYLVEFVADKIPLVDNVWDAIHTVVRPPAAALLAYSAFGTVPEAWKIGAALLAGSVALTSHGAKASTRAAANASPEPFSNWLLSVTEDGLSIFLTWMASAHPIASAVIVLILVVLSALLIRKIVGFLRRVRARFGGRPAAARPTAPPAAPPA
jgi:hypothetical protein